MSKFYDKVAALDGWEFQTSEYRDGYVNARDAAEDIAIEADNEIARLNAIIAEFKKDN
jgi:hypothetical protein